MEGFQDCTNATFTTQSVGTSVQYGYILNPGFGCYITIDRTDMGSIGSMQVTYDDPTSILVFDKDNRNYMSGSTLNMPVTDYGWAPRKVFVVNKGTQQAAFSVQFMNGILNKFISTSGLLGLICATLLLTL